MTNGRSVFSPSLGEFALAAILYFVKDLRRMIRNQTASLWETFDVMPVSGQTVCIVGYGDIGRTVGMNVIAVKRHVPASQVRPACAPDFYISHLFLLRHDQKIRWMRQAHPPRKAVMARR
jgi:phosphoglycerate dehydrogenase-like enzyme